MKSFRYILSVLFVFVIFSVNVIGQNDRQVRVFDGCIDESQVTELSFHSGNYYPLVTSNARVINYLFSIYGDVYNPNTHSTNTDDYEYIGFLIADGQYQNMYVMFMLHDSGDYVFLMIHDDLTRTYRDDRYQIDSPQCGGYVISLNEFQFLVQSIEISSGADF